MAKEEEIPKAWKEEETRARQALYKAKVECEFILQWRPFLQSGFDGDHVLEVRCLSCNTSIQIHDEESQFSGREASLEAYVQHALKEHRSIAPDDASFGEKEDETASSRQLRFFHISIPATRTMAGVVQYHLEVSAWLSVGGRHKKLEWNIDRRFREFVQLRQRLAKRGHRVEEIRLSKRIRYGLTKLKTKESIIEKRRQVIEHFCTTLARRACDDVEFLAFLGCGKLGDVIDNPSLTIHHPRYQNSTRRREINKNQRLWRSSPLHIFASLFCCVSLSGTTMMSDDEDEGGTRNFGNKAMKKSTTASSRRSSLKGVASSLVESRFSSGTIASDLARASSDSSSSNRDQHDENLRL